MSGAVPSFDIEGGLLLALVRGLTDVGLLSAFGTLIVRTVVLPKALVGASEKSVAIIDRQLLTLVRGSLVLALLNALAWLVLAAGVIAGASGIARSLSAAPFLLTGTFFGHLIAAQATALLAAGLALGGGGRPLRWWLAAGLSAIATSLHAGHGHAMAMYDGPSLLMLSEVLHLLAAGAWLGGLLPLALVVRAMPPKTGASAARWFSPLGKICIAGMVVSAGFQFWVMIGGLPGLVGTAYGWTALVKFLLLLVLLVFAVANRYRLAPALLRPGAPSASRTLQVSIALQTGFGLLVVLAAAVLSSLPPAMHIQPFWPFSEQFSLVAVAEDPSLRTEVVEAAAALAVACVLLAAGAFARRITRWAAFLAAAILVWFAVPHLDLLLVTAYPTSFYQSPTGFSANAISIGADLYPEHCASCHGADGRGDGPDAKGLPIPPADLTAGHLWAHSDGELFWWLSHGIDAPEGGLAMPGFSDVLSDDERWNLIDFIRARNAGLRQRGVGSWPLPVQAPDFAVTCARQGIRTLLDLRGRVARLVFATDVGPESRTDSSQVPSNSEVVTILVTGEPAVDPAHILCAASDPDAWRAYGIISSTQVTDMPDTQFLVDPQGFLRLIQRPSGSSSGWDQPDVLERVSRTISDHPISTSQGGQHQHH
jgi:putative copper export protein/mono/diheme cytochrome c family protein